MNADHFDPDDPRLTAYLLGELPASESAAVEAWLEISPLARTALEETDRVVQLLSRGLQAEPAPALHAAQRAAITAAASTPQAPVSQTSCTDGSAGALPEIIIAAMSPSAANVPSSANLASTESTTMKSDVIRTPAHAAGQVVVRGGSRRTSITAALLTTAAAAAVAVPLLWQRSGSMRTDVAMQPARAPLATTATTPPSEQRVLIARADHGARGFAKGPGAMPESVESDSRFGANVGTHQESEGIVNLSRAERVDELAGGESRNGISGRLGDVAKAADEAPTIAGMPLKDARSKQPSEQPAAGLIIADRTLRRGKSSSVSDADDAKKQSSSPQSAKNEALEAWQVVDGKRVGEKGTSQEGAADAMNRALAKSPANVLGEQTARLRYEVTPATGEPAPTSGPAAAPAASSPLPALSATRAAGMKPGPSPTPDKPGSVPAFKMPVGTFSQATLADAPGAAKESAYRRSDERELAESKVQLQKRSLVRQQDVKAVDALELKWTDLAVAEKSKADVAAVVFDAESYAPIEDNRFQDVLKDPLSTFSIDVDTASYANVRRFLNEGRLPAPAAVRIEEMVNYFSYDYPQPQGDVPFSVNLETVTCPWNPEHRLVRIGLKAKEIAPEKRPVSNLVFLLDVSGSMQTPTKLPLVKAGMQMLLDKLSENDRVAITVYAGASGLVLDSTTADHKEIIQGAIENLQAGGSTNGGAGIELAYRVASDHFIKGGTNRVILCTDGDFNVGTTGPDELNKLITEKAKSGVFLSVLGFGTGNIKDSTLESLADKGNGNYAYIDTLREAKKVLVDDMQGTLITVAKDVKLQIEFNPAIVASYRLIGYENRVMAAEDFANDKKDAGEIGAGHTVTALYELTPAVVEPDAAPAAELKYQRRAKAVALESLFPNELLTLKLRYKQPDGDTSRLVEYPLVKRDATVTQASKDFAWAASVAEFGMILRDSPFKGNATLAAVLETAEAAKGDDPTGLRAEFLALVKQAQQLSGKP